MVKRLRDFWPESCVITGGVLLALCGYFASPENPVAGPILAACGLALIVIGSSMVWLWVGVRKSKKRQLLGHIEIAAALGATEGQLAPLRKETP
jgi:hypothetical protein